VLVGDKEPHVGARHGTAGVPWVVVQVTPPLAGSFRIVGVKSWVIFTGMMADTGETETTIARTVTVTEPDFVESEREVAVIVTGKFAAGGVDGAV
jgi:hypothetical protein